MKKTLSKLKPKYFFDDEGNKIGVLLSEKAFENLIEELEELNDTTLVLKRLKKKEKNYSFDEIQAETLARLRK